MFQTLDSRCWWVGFQGKDTSKHLATWDLLMGSKYSNGAKCFPGCALWPCDTASEWLHVKARMRLCDLLSRRAVSAHYLSAMCGLDGNHREITTVSQGRLGWTLSYMLFKPILLYSLHRRMETSPHLRNTPLQSQHGPHTELLVFFNQPNNYFRFLWEEVPRILRLHL